MGQQLDYLTSMFDDWILDKENRICLGLEVDGKLVSFVSTYVLPSGKLALHEAGRIQKDFRNAGLWSKMKTYHLEQNESFFKEKKIRPKITWTALLGDNNRAIHEPYIVFRFSITTWTSPSLATLADNGSLALSVKEINPEEWLELRMGKVQEHQLQPKDVFLLGWRPYENTIESLKLMAQGKLCVFQPVHFFRSKDCDSDISVAVVTRATTAKIYDVTIMCAHAGEFRAHAIFHALRAIKMGAKLFRVCGGQIQQHSWISMAAKTQSLVSWEDGVYCEEKVVSKL